jgi:hypothetical protein
MTTYQINLNAETRTFDTQYPILLHEKGVPQQDFTHTVQHVTRLYQEIVPTPSPFTRVAVTLLIFLIGGGICAGATFGLAYSGAHNFLFLPPVLFILVMFSITLSFTVIWLKKYRAARARFNTDAMQFLDAENNNKYYPKGVQFLLKESGQMYYTGNDARRVVHLPMLEVLITNRPIHPDVAIDMYQQPTMYQQQPVVYQQQPTEYSDQYGNNSYHQPLVQQTNVDQKY